MMNVKSDIQNDRLNAILKAVLDATRLTRAGLADLLHLSSSSIVKYTKTLIDNGLLRESDTVGSTGGRRSTLLELNPDAGLVVAVVLDVTHVRGAVLDAAGRVLDEAVAPARLGIPKDELLSELFGLIDRLVAQVGARRQITGIGIGMGGYIDPARGISYEYLYARDWYDVPLRQLVEDRYHVQGYLVKDANAAALGEKYRGRGVGVDHFICVWMGEGIGMGIVANGELYTGKSACAGELGHVRAVEGGALCFCGHAGCLETVCAEQFILAACRDSLRQGVNSEILKHCGGDEARITIEHVIAAANAGDRLACSIMANVGRVMGTKLGDVANILNPELIILRGPVIDGNAYLHERVRAHVLDQSLKPMARGLRVEYSGGRDEIRFAGIVSAILIDRFFGTGGRA
jgi:N-acetylglucosamine repressor